MTGGEKESEGGAGGERQDGVQDSNGNEEREREDETQKQDEINAVPTLETLGSSDDDEGEQNTSFSDEGNGQPVRQNMENKQKQMEDMKGKDYDPDMKEVEDESVTPESEPEPPTKRIHRNLDYEKLQRSYASTIPMSRSSRMKYYIRRMFNQNSPGETSSDHNRSKQIEIPPRESMTIFRGFFYMWTLRFVDYTIWNVQTSYFNFLTVSVIGYIFWVMCFALVLSGVSYGNEVRGGKECITNWIYSGARSHNFEIAFELSWTTFSTVGYGAVSPSASQTGCWYIRILCAIEAFFGVIYFGYCGAIFFSKISTLMADAHVTFSSAVCIQYGSGVIKQQDVGDEEDLKKSHSRDAGYPVLSIRLVNTKGNRLGWEIVGAEMKGLVLMNSPMQVNSLNLSRDPNVISGYKIRSRRLKNKGNDDDEDKRRPPMRLTLRKVDFQPSSHPYFAKVWHARHILNENSPFIKESVKEEIRRHGGWPPERNTHASIRSALVEFSNLAVTMGGTSNATHEGVFVEHKYKFDDVCVGWQFANVVFLARERLAGMNWINLDLSLAHDIHPQVGGGQEPLGGVKFD